MSLWRGVTQKSLDFRSTKFILGVRRCHAQHVCYKEYYRRKHGNREIVGYGINGTPSYYDWQTYPFPAIRFREFGPELTVLKQNLQSS